MAIDHAMRWSHLKDISPGEIFDAVSRFVFPAIKKMRNGRLPEMDELGRIVGDESEAEAASPEDMTAFSYNSSMLYS